jgi:hypothetical protein
VNVSFDSKLYLLADKDQKKASAKSRQIDELREKKLKILSYGEHVRNIGTKEDDEKKLQS